MKLPYLWDVSKIELFFFKCCWFECSHIIKLKFSTSKSLFKLKQYFEYVGNSVFSLIAVTNQDLLSLCLHFFGTHWHRAHFVYFAQSIPASVFPGQAFNDETTFILYLTHSHALSLPLPFTERNQWALKHVEGRQQNGKRVHTKHRLKHVLFSKKNTFISCFTTPPLIVHARQSIRLLRLEMGQLCTVY